LWFFELRAREALGFGQRKSSGFVSNNPYLTRGDANNRVVIPASLLRNVEFAA